MYDEDRGWDKEAPAELYMYAVLGETLQACFDVVLKVNLLIVVPGYAIEESRNSTLWEQKECGKVGWALVCLREKLLRVMKFKVESNRT